MALRKAIGSSMVDLNALDEQQDTAKFKEKTGLLRRAFSSKRKKKPKQQTTHFLTPDYVPNSHIKQPLRICRSNPIPRSNPESRLEKNLFSALLMTKNW